MQNMTKRLLAAACALWLCAAVNADTGKQKTHQADSRASAKAVEPAAGGKVQNSQLQKFLDWPPASDAAKKRMKKKK